MEHASSNRLDRVPWYTVPAIFVGVPVVLWLLVQLNPDLFWDRFVWKYYWGPIVADAEGVARLTRYGVTAEAGYNVVNTLTWAALLGVSILGLAQVLHRFRQPMDTRLIFGATAWVVAGSIWHVIEDVETFEPWLQYLFITPPIYLLFGAFGVFSFVFGHWLARIEARTDQEQALRQLWLLLMLIALVYTLLWWTGWDKVSVYANPVWVAAAAAVTHLLVRARARKLGRIDPSDLVLTLTTGWFVMGFVYVGMYIQDPGRWNSDLAGGMPSAVLLAPALAGAVVGIVYLIARRGDGLVAQAFRAPVNLLIIFSQSLDGFATALGIDLAGYIEKHVLSGRVIDGFVTFAERIGWQLGAENPTFFAFVPLKIGLALLVVYIMDVKSREEQAENPTVMGIVKFAIIMVGIGPGVRNFLRLSLGV